MTGKPKDVRDLLVWSLDPHPEWHDPEHPDNKARAEAPEPSGRRADPGHALIPQVGRRRTVRSPEMDLNR